MLSVAWYLRGQLSKIAISLAKIEAAIASAEEQTTRNTESTQASHRRIDNHEIRLALLETVGREVRQ